MYKSKKVMLEMIIYFHQLFLLKIYKVQKISKYKPNHPYFYHSGKIVINILVHIILVIFTYILMIFRFSKHTVLQTSFDLKYPQNIFLYQKSLRKQKWYFIVIFY